MLPGAKQEEKIQNQLIFQCVIFQFYTYRTMAYNNLMTFITASFSGNTST